MEKIELFTDSIIVDYLFDEELDNKIIKVLQAEEKNNKGNKISNFGGFQTKPIKDQKICHTLLVKSGNAISQAYDVKFKYSLINLWINKNLKHNFNMPHIHPRSDFSGVYYVEVKENNGDLVFIRNDVSNKEIDGLFHKTDFVSSSTIKPKKNQLILFPSNLQHMVTPHEEEGLRISVSFNLSLDR